jgi:hypothetical protein
MQYQQLALVISAMHGYMWHTAQVDGCTASTWGFLKARYKTAWQEDESRSQHMARMGFFRCNGCQRNKLLLMASVLDGALLYPESPVCGL